MNLFNLLICQPDVTQFYCPFSEFAAILLAMHRVAGSQARAASRTPSGRMGRGPHFCNPMQRPNGVSTPRGPRTGAPTMTAANKGLVWLTRGDDAAIPRGVVELSVPSLTSTVNKQRQVQD